MLRSLFRAALFVYMNPFPPLLVDWPIHVALNKNSLFLPQLSLTHTGDWNPKIATTRVEVEVTEYVEHEEHD